MAKSHPVTEPFGTPLKWIEAGKSKCLLQLLRQDLPMESYWLAGWRGKEPNGIGCSRGWWGWWRCACMMRSKKDVMFDCCWFYMENIYGMKICNCNIWLSMSLSLQYFLAGRIMCLSDCDSDVKNGISDVLCSFWLSYVKPQRKAP